MNNNNSPSKNDKFLAYAKEKGIDLTRPFLVLNSELHDKDNFAFPKYVLEEYEYTPQEYNYYFGKLNNIKGLFSFTPTNELLFQQGKAIVFLTGMTNLPAKRGSGGQPLTNDQSEILSSLNATTFLAVERIRILHEITRPRGTSHNIETQRNEILKEIASEYWAKKDERGILPDKQINLNVILRNGQRPETLKELYPIENPPKANIEWVKQHFESYSKKDLEWQIFFEKNLIGSLLNCVIAEKLAVKAIADASDRVRTGNNETPQQRQLVTACIHDMKFSDVMLVAFSSNYNPANTFANLKHRSHDFEVMANIGRLHRQLKINPEASSIIIDESNLEDIARHLHIIASWGVLSSGTENPALKELMLWGLALRMVCDYETWKKVLARYNVDQTSLNEFESMCSI